MRTLDIKSKNKVFLMSKTIKNKTQKVVTFSVEEKIWKNKTRSSEFNVVNVRDLNTFK